MKTKAKQPAPGKDLAALLEETTNRFRPAYLLKGTALQPLPAELSVSTALIERKFKSAKELEQVALRNSKTLFGQHTFMVTLQNKKGVATKGNSVPCFFMLSLGEPTKPRIYILDIVPAKYDFFGSLFPRITKFFSYLQSEENIETLCKLMTGNKELMKVLQATRSNRDIPDFLKNVLEGKLFILLITDGEIKELPEIMATYPAWESVRQLALKKYASNGNTLCSLQPPFAEIHANGKSKKEKVTFTEEYHLEDVTPEVLSIYKRIKSELLAANNQLQFNPQKYYISLRKTRNLAFFSLSRKKITLVVMNPEKDTRKQIKHFEIKTLTEKVQKFWNGPSCSIVIDKNEHLKEVIDLLKKLVKA